MSEKKKGNMYIDSVEQWNVIVGCKYSCKYCLKSFQAQMKRQKHNCIKCYNYEPHLHPERLKQPLPKTYGDKFIWACSSGDITFAKKEWMDKILERVRELSNRTFFFQTKNPKCFHDYNFPDNVILGITLETNKSDRNYSSISKAPKPIKRYADFLSLPFERKIVTIEPIMSFDLRFFVELIKDIAPERVYIGYDTKKSNLPEPNLDKTLELCKELSKFTKVKIKFMKSEHYCPSCFRRTRRKYYLQYLKDETSAAYRCPRCGHMWQDWVLKKRIENGVFYKKIS